MPRWAAVHRRITWAISRTMLAPPGFQFPRSLQLHIRCQVLLITLMRTSCQPDESPAPAGREQAGTGLGVGRYRAGSGRGAVRLLGRLAARGQVLLLQRIQLGRPALVGQAL